MNINGKTGVFLKIPGLGQTVFVILHKEGKGIPGDLSQGPELSVTFREVAFELTGIGLEIKDDIQKPAENRDEHDKENPG
jgi:hypothetical protein